MLLLQCIGTDITSFSLTRHLKCFAVCFFFYLIFISNQEKKKLKPFFTQFLQFCCWFVLLYSFPLKVSCLLSQYMNSLYCLVHILLNTTTHCFVLVNHIKSHKIPLKHIIVSGYPHESGNVIKREKVSTFEKHCVIWFDLQLRQTVVLYLV